MKKIKTLIFLVFLIGIISCEEFLMEENLESPTVDNFFGPDGSESAVEQLINGIYPTGIWAFWDRRFSWFATVPADGFDHTTAYDTEGQEYDNHQFNASQFNIFRMWNYLWWPIARANSYLANHDNLVQLHGENWSKLDRFKGEALFLRSYWYFFGIQAWGEIPLVVDEFPEGTLHGNSNLTELYNQIIQDCQTILDENLLPNWQSYSNTENEGRATRGAVKTLLGKIYLTRATSSVAQSGDFQSAADILRDVIDNEGYELITTPDLLSNGDTLYTAYQKPFIPEYENGSEGILEYQFGGGNAGSRNRLNGEFVPPGFYSANDGGKLRFTASNLLVSSFESGDIRRLSFHTGNYINQNTGQESQVDAVWMAKFWDPSGNASNDFENNFPLLRYSDVLLMFAEAINESQGPTSEAYQAVNTVRSRAGLPDLSGLDQGAFREAVRNERFIELAGEGWRLWDLRRWGFDYLKQRVEASNPNATVEPHEILWPIPDYELSVNPLLNQNPGY